MNDELTKALANKLGEAAIPTDARNVEAVARAAPFVDGFGR